MDNSAQNTLAIATLVGEALSRAGHSGSRSRGKNNWAAKIAASEAKKVRNRRNNKLARKSRRLNLRRGKVAGNQ